MPIDRKKYPRKWRKISYFIRFVRAKGKCEECGAKHGEPHPKTGTEVELHTAHLDHNPANCSFFNLKSLCHVCHLAHDRRDNWRRRLYGPTGKYHNQIKLFE
ncbi:hypothetical protein ACAW74_05115 [Fibrella sp. WM1]|uniref:hypothetical protein n=1 Tax=Fibrella musci TaxID=3242485 RepID=UPI003520D057